MPLSNTTLDILASQPYWDDFDRTKNFHRILIRPKVSVQTRELNQLQSILQNQVEQFGSGIFTEGATVRGGRQTLVTTGFALQLQRDDLVDIANFYDEATGKGYIVRGQSSGAEGQIIEIARQSGETNTAVVYTPRNAKQFQREELIQFIDPDNDTIVSATLTAARTSSASIPPVRRALVFGIEAGVFFVRGHFIETTRQTTVLGTNGVIVSRRIGFDVKEEIVTEATDTSLYDPALGTTNYSAPGAHRLKLTVNLVNKPVFTSPTSIQTDEENFVELARVIDGTLSESVQRFESTLFDNTLAERTFDQSGDYVVDPFVLLPTDHNPSPQIPNARGYLTITASSNVVVTGDVASSTTLDPLTDVVTPVMTVFTEDVAVGDILLVQDEQRLVTAVVNNTTLRVNTAFARDYTNVPFVVKSPRKMTLSLDPGRAYVRGYQVNTFGTTHLEVNRPRETKNINNGIIQTTYGPYVLVNRNKGLFNVNTTPLVELHCVPFANSTSDNANTDTKIGTARMRLMVPDRSAATYGEGDANTAYQFYYVSPEFTRKTFSSTPIVSINAVASTLTLNSVITKSNVDNQPFTGALVSLYSGVTGDILRYTVTSSSLSGNNQVLKLTPSAFLDTVNTSGNVLVDFNETCIRGFGDSANSTSGGTKGASVPVYGRVGLTINGITQVYGAGLAPEMFRLREQWLKQGSLSDVSYDAFVYLPSVTAAGSPPAGKSVYSISLTDPAHQLGFATDTPVYNNFIVSNGSGFVSLLGANVTVLSSTTANLVINVASVGTVSVYVKARITPQATRTKLLVRANTTVANVFVNSTGYLTTNTTRGHIAINMMNVASSNIVSLGIPDVYNVQKVYVASAVDTGAGVITATVDVTDRYTLDTGQRDWCYDHASLVLKPGYAHYSNGNYKMVAMVDWFQHTPNTGVLTVDSYTNSGLTDPYADIPVFTSPTTGTKLPLRDYVDFRPLRTANTAEANTAHNPYVAANTFFEEQIHPDPNGFFLADYEHYLARTDKVVLSKTGKLQVITGASSITPQPPNDLDNALTLYVVKYPPYVSNVQMVSYETFDYRRYTMRDIAQLEKRIERLEYYAQISLLEDRTFNTPELDVNDVERFKNGILVDPFISSAIVDVTDPDTRCGIDHLKGGLYPKHTSYAFLLSNVVNSTTGLHANRTVHVPYTQTPVITQPLASKHESVNPFNVPSWTGELTLSPEIDTWFQTNTYPTVVQNLYGENDNWIQGTESFGSVWSSWTSYWEGESQLTSSPFIVNQVTNQQAPITPSLEFIDVTRFVTTRSGFQPRSGVKLKSKSSAILVNVSGKTLDAAVIPFMRPRAIMLHATGLKPSTRLRALFDGQDVTNYIERANELQFATAADAAKFIPGQMIVARQTDISGNAVGTAMVAGVSDRSVFIVNATGKFYDDTSSTIVIDMALPTTVVYKGDVIPANTRRYATSSGYKSYSGRVGLNASIGATTLRLDTGTATTVGVYANAEIVITSGPGAGQRRTITSYAYSGGIGTVGFTPALTSFVSTDSRYSIGPLTTASTTVDAAPVDGAYDENGVLATYFAVTTSARQPGTFYGTFQLPGNTFAVGERTLVLTDNTSASLSSTLAIAKFRASGIANYVQNTVIKTRTTQLVTTDDATKTDPYNTTTQNFGLVTNGQAVHPLGQLFLLDSETYSEGVFITAVDLFFAQISLQGSKFTVQLRKVRDGVITDDILASSTKMGTANFNTVPIINDAYVTPDPTDATHYTRFYFEEPVYLDAGYQYALVLLSNSNDYRVFIGEFSKQVIGSTQVISQQPYMGVLYYPENGNGRLPVQNETLMFALQRAVFSTDASSPTFTLAETINSTSTQVSVDSNGNFDFDLMRVSAEIKEFDATKNNTSFIVRVCDPTTNLLDSYEIPLREDLLLSTRARVRASNTTCVQLIPTVQTTSDAVAPVMFAESFRLTGVRHLIDNGQLYANGFTIQNPGSNYTANVTITISGDTGSGATALAVVNASSGKVESVQLTTAGSGYIETPTLSYTGNATIVYRGETSPVCQIVGEEKARYITRRVNLVDGFDASDIKAYILANRPANTNIDVYYKVLAAGDKDRFEDKNWTRMVLRPDQETQYAKAFGEYNEYEYRTVANSAAYTSNSVTYNRFNMFALKLVLRTDNTTSVPRVDNLRAIALDS